MNLHSWSGRHGVPGGLQRWQHGSYRWRRGVEAVALMAALVILAPHVVEVAAGAALMALGVLMLVCLVLPRCLWRRFDVLALLLAVVAIVEARRRRI